MLPGRPRRRDPSDLEISGGVHPSFNGRPAAGTAEH
jgi:hypothetical protein